jgi:hypothetical protein
MSYRGRSHGRAEGITEAWSKASREKSAETIVVADTSLQKWKKKVGGLTKRRRVEL